MTPGCNIRGLTQAAAFVLLLSGCGSAPTTGGSAPQLRQDERALWHRVELERDAIERSGFVADWPEVEAYLNDVLARLGAGSGSGELSLKVRVIIDPTLNAFVLPNGAMYIHTGLLARLENEAQLAAVLGHEVTHATARHGIKAYRNAKSHGAFLAVLTVGTGGIGGLLGGLGVLASVSGYSQDLEREADTAGFRMLVAAGYDPREAPKVFRTFREESRRSKLKEPFFFGSHPRLTERIASYDDLLASLPAAQRRGASRTVEYRAVLPRVLLANAEAAAGASDFEFARTCAERCVELDAENPEARCELAEVLRRRDQEGDAAAAREHYQAVIAKQPDMAKAHRGLGLVSLKTGDRELARRAFLRYLELAPAATDRAYIRNYLQQCDTPN